MRRTTQLALPLGQTMTDQTKTAHPVPKAAKGNGRDRLFVPLSSEPYAWFESGTKTWELRKAERQFTEKHLRPGRDVELRRGYSDPRNSLWGRISDVKRAKSVEQFFQSVPYRQVIPKAENRSEAISIAKRILNIEQSTNKDVIGFRVDLDSHMRIPLKNEFLPLVKSGFKTTTIRVGLRNLPLGPAAIVCGTEQIPIFIKNVSHKNVSDLDEHDAHADGFSSKPHLFNAMHSIYPNLAENDIVTIIEFDLLCAFDNDK